MQWPCSACATDAQRPVTSGRHRRARLSAPASADSTILASLGLLAWSFDPASGRILHLGGAVQDLFGRAAEHLVGPYEALVAALHPDDRAEVERYFSELMRHGAAQAALQLTASDGSVRRLRAMTRAWPDAQGRALRIDGIWLDDAAPQPSVADELTGLPNWARMQGEIARLQQGARPGADFVALLVLDLDHFHRVNEALGQAGGDAVLTQVAHVLTCSADAQSVARIGGDTFAVLVPLGGTATPQELARRLIGAIGTLRTPGGANLQVSACVGIALCPRDGAEPATLLKNAEHASYRARARGAGSVCTYLPTIDEAIRREYLVEQELREALEHDRFVLHYQPQVDLRTGVVIGFEALLRWRHPQRGLLAPAEFISIAEQSGLIVAIGDWVLRQACRQAQAWNRSQGTRVRIAVNVSGRQFGPDLLASVAVALAESGLDPRLLELELTETVLMHDSEQARGLLEQIKAMGVALAVDDFGTGYSGLSYLRRFPLDRLKIDRSFVRDLAVRADDAALCATIIEMAHGLRLEVVAEGVETQAQLEFLVQRHCEVMQGYLFSPPLAAKAAEALLRSGRLQALPRTEASIAVPQQPGPGPANGIDWQ